MSRRRVDRLEDALSPTELVKRWLSEAHAYGSLPAYAESLVGQPETAQPFITLPDHIARTMYASMRRERPEVIKAASRSVVADTCFLLQLALDLNVHVEETLRFERMRHAALVWWSRTLDPAEGDDDAEPGRWSDWRRGVATLRGALSGTEEAVSAIEARYLDRRRLLFPELAASWQDLCAAAEYLDAGTSERDETAARAAAQAVRRVLLMARADGLEASDPHAADAMAERVMRLGRTSATEATDG